MFLLAVVGQEKQQDSGAGVAFLLLGRKDFRSYLINSGRPGIKRFPREKEEKQMFQGTMIDELISTVERAEQNARQQQDQTASPASTAWTYPLGRMEWRGFTEVA